MEDRPTERDASPRSTKHKAALEMALGRRGLDESTRERLARLVAHMPESDRYSEAKQIGVGGMGTVYSVWEEDLKRRLAMKVTRRTDDDEADAQILGRFLEEAQITGQLEHPGVVPVHDIGVNEDGHVYFTMMLVRGRSFDEVIRAVHAGDAEWTRERALSVILRVCETLAFAHSKNVIHRDIKPANIMVGQFGEAYVVDWGLARFLDRPDVHVVEFASNSNATPEVASMVTVDGQALGTPAFMPPEQARGEMARVGAGSDVYSVGATLYALLAGHSPYAESGQGTAGHTVLMRLLDGPPPPIESLAPDAPPELVAICERAMQRDVERRYADTSEMADDLRAFLENRVVKAYRRGPIVELQKWVQRNRATAAAISALVVVAIGAAITVALTESSKRRQVASALRDVERERDRRAWVTDSITASALLARVDDTSPDAAGIARMRRWIELHDDLLARRSDALRLDALPQAAREALESHEAEALAANLAALATSRDGVARALAVAEQLRKRSIDDEADGWRTAIAAIRSSDRYDGIEMTPQLGLVPLREDPRSGLWEFWYALGGDMPVADADGDWQIGADTGLVFVLVPGGRFRMGTPVAEIPFGAFNEFAHEVDLAPFFASKYELTQGQWQRVMGGLPARYGPGVERPGVTFDLRHPVESVSANDADACARKLALSLPTEAQWEYLARAGSTAAFPWGDDAAGAETRENVSDQSLWELSDAVAQGRSNFAPWTDGYGQHAPVGSFAANAFGLHDVSGNVGEWTASNFDPSYGLQDLDAPELSESVARNNSRKRVVRGGNWYLPPELAYSALRQPLLPGNANQTIGVRFVRAVE